MYGFMYGLSDQHDIWSCCPSSLFSNSPVEEICLGGGSDERVLSHPLTYSLVPSYCIVRYNPSIVLGTPPHAYCFCAFPGSSIFSPPETHPPARSTIKKTFFIQLVPPFVHTKHHNHSISIICMVEHPFNKPKLHSVNI